MAKRMPDPLPPHPDAPDWHTLSHQDALSTLESATAGLHADEARARLTLHGPNELPEGVQRSLLRRILDQFSDFMIIILIGAAIVAGIVGEPVDSVSILVIVLLNAAIGLFQEWRANRAMAALRMMAAPTAHVRRHGQVIAVPAAELVPGDVVLLEAGNVVPADLRLFEAARLRTAEAALTGESQPVDKSTEAIPTPTLPLGDRTNMAWKGTLVATGRGEGVVVATGLGTELGRIARLLANADEVKTPLQKRLTRFGTRLAWAVLAICGIVFVAGLIRGEPPEIMFLTAVSLAVAAIPEALPAVIVISLSLGAAKMVRHHALIRRLPAVETLGSITYICTDKTGTLTENRMRAEAFVPADAVATPDASPAGVPSRPALSPAFLRCMALVNDVTGTGEGALGDPTEVALVEAALAHGVDKIQLEQRHPRKAELPFDSERKRMSTVHVDGERFLVCVKGAPEGVLSRCTQHLGANGLAPFDPGPLEAAAERLAGQGLRVLAFAERYLDALPDESPAGLDAVERDLVFLGLVGLMDPPREEALRAVDECKTAGIVPVMITGDHPATARAIAERLGIVGATGRVVTGAELAAMSDPQLAAEVRDIRVYARVDPEQKIRIVQALQAAGHFVAMTGDGVNDAPALKRADIGVAMGRGGTDVAREAAHMILLDDNFASIVSAVREGRRIFDNIRKFIKYTMTSNAGEIWTILLAPFLGLPIPLLPIHILWINLVTDGLPGLALATEPPSATSCGAPRAPRPRASSPTACGSTSSGSASSWAPSASSCRPGRSRPAPTGRRWSSPCCACPSSATPWRSAPSATASSRSACGPTAR